MLHLRQPTKVGGGGEWPDEPMYWMDTYVPPAFMVLGTPIVNVFGGSWIYATHEAEALRILREGAIRWNEMTTS